MREPDTKIEKPMANKGANSHEPIANRRAISLFPIGYRLLALLLPIAYWVIFVRCSEAPKVAIPPYKRVVLCELFTHIRCPYCPYAARALDRLEKEFAAQGDTIAIIAYHRRRLGDTLSPSYVEDRKLYYYPEDIEPSLFFDGEGPVRTEDPALNYETYKARIMKRLGVKPRVKLHLDTVFFYSPHLLQLKLRLVRDTILPDSLRLFIIATEDSVRCYLPRGSDSIFGKVVRLMWPSSQGLPIALPADTLTAEYQIPWRSEWRRELLQIVIFVQDKLSKEVLATVRRRNL